MTTTTSKPHLTIEFHSAFQESDGAEVQGIVKNLQKHTDGKVGIHIKFTRGKSHHHADMEFIREIEPVWNPNSCLLSKECSDLCPMGAIKRDKNGKMVYVSENCDYCGLCITACPNESWQIKRNGWSIWVGGQKGRQPVSGINIAEFIADSEIVHLIEKSIDWYKKNQEADKGFCQIIHKDGLSKLNQYIDTLFPI